MHASRWPAWLRKASLWLFVAFFVLYFYTFLHEAGHGLAAVLFGGQVLAINVDFITMGAHVRTAGAFTPLQNSLKSLAGPGLPVLTWAAFMLAVPRRAGLALELVKTLSTLMVLNSTLPWVVIPLLYTKGLAPAATMPRAFSGSPARARCGWPVQPSPCTRRDGGSTSARSRACVRKSGCCKRRLRAWGCRHAGRSWSWPSHWRWA